MLEDHKYLPPKFSKAVSDLAIVSGVQEWAEYMKEKRERKRSESKRRSSTRVSESKA